MESGIKGEGGADAAEVPPAEGAGSEVWPREQMIAVAAYYIAQKRGFTPDQDLDDWLRAEAEIEEMLRHLP